MADGDIGNLVLLPVAHDDDDTPVTKEQHGWCRHKKVRIDPTAHRLYCRECDREIDPLDYLTTLANDWGYYVREREAAIQKRNKALRELEDVLRRLRNAKQRLARAQKGATIEERVADGRDP